ncbi:alpha/beta hydrolase [Curtobacterium flaccumfaciens]|nr:alpha/beta hydrolase [Curtobacterium flaccumfaciens]
MHAIDTDPRGRGVASDGYAPYPVRVTPGAWGLTRTVVDTPDRPRRGAPPRRPGPAPAAARHRRLLVDVDPAAARRGRHRCPRTGARRPARLGVLAGPRRSVRARRRHGCRDRGPRSTGPRCGRRRRALHGRVRRVAPGRGGARAGPVARAGVRHDGRDGRCGSAPRPGARPPAGVHLAASRPDGDRWRRSSAAPGIARIGLLPLVAAPVFTHVRRLDPSVLAAFVDELRPEQFTEAARSAAAYDVDRWRAITCPVTAIAGRDDVFARVSDLAALRALVPQTRTVLLEACGHFAHVERPDAVAHELGLV